MHDFAMARLTWAMSFMTKTGMDINEAVLLSFDVASYAPIITHREKVLEQLQQGVSLHEAFFNTQGFPCEFLMNLQTGEQSGELPETLAKLSQEFIEQTKIQMKFLSLVSHFVVFMIMATIIFSFISQLGQFYTEAV